jgi:Xaa-Pro dipeptidase
MLMNERRTLELMKEEGVDALLGTTIENTYYLAGLWSVDSYLFPRDSQIYVLVTAQALNDPIIILPTSNADCIFECPKEPKHVYPYGNFYRELVENHELSERESKLKEWVIGTVIYADSLSALEQALRDEGLLESGLAIDEKGFKPSHIDGLRSHFPKARFLNGSELLTRIRSVKTDDEIRRMKRACLVNEEGIRDAISIAKEGTMERDMWLAYRESIVRNGGTPIFELINFDRNTGFGNLYSTEDQLSKGQHIRFDVGCRVDGYVSDISRIFSYGEPDKRKLDYYTALRKGNEAGIDALRPGVRASDIFEIVVNTTRNSGIPHYRRHHTGHGIGLEIYEPPLIAPGSDMIIEKGMTLAIEAPYFELGFAGLQIEDIVRVTDDGAEYLSLSSRDLVIFE